MLKDYENDELARFPSDAGYPGNKADWGWIQHINASLNASGKAAIVMGTGSASRGSGEVKNSQEKLVRKYFIENDLIETVILLPFNLFYNTDAPGLIYIINKSKPLERSGKVLFINASTGFDRGKPKNILSNKFIKLIPRLYSDFSESEGISRIVDTTEIKAQDYNLRPSRYVFKVLKSEALPILQIQNSFSESCNSAYKLAQQLQDQILQIGDSTKGTKECEFGKILSDCKLVPLKQLVKEYNCRAGSKTYPVFSVSKIFGIIRQNEKFGSTEVASIDTANYKIVKTGMFAYDPMLLWDGSIGLNRYPYDGIVSPAYTVFQMISDEIKPDYLEFVLRSRMMIPFYISVSDGTNMRRRKAKFSDFSKLRIPKLPDEYEAAISNCIRLQAKVENLKKETRAVAMSIFHAGMYEEI